MAPTPGRAIRPTRWRCCSSCCGRRSALYLLALGPWRWTLAIAAIGLPALFFLVNDRIVMPTEEAMLRKLHPEEYDAYAARVRRWFGRKAG